MGKQLDTEIIKGDPVVLSVAPAFDRKSSAETIRGVGTIIVEEDNQIYNTAGIELSLEGSAGNMIKTAAKNKEIANAIYSIDGNFASKTKLSC
jgi:hypothetical protein